MRNELIKQFVDDSSFNAMSTLLESDSEQEVIKAGVQIAQALELGNGFEKIADSSTDSEGKLISSFHNNLVLLIQKTWVEKTDESLKAQVLYHMDEFTEQLEKKSYASAYSLFFEIVEDVVYLMFGNQTKTKDFDDYALHIDPEFGIFWWYFKELPPNAKWSAEKTRIAVLLGMYFLANY